MVMVKPSAREISVVFVRQYYTLLNESPEQMHRFYSHDSSFVHGDFDSEPLFIHKPARGQKEINERIKEIHFKDARTKIRQVDAFPTLANGVVIQVSGLMSNNGRPLRPFMQTFVLAQQTGQSYYVYNDIFRYQDEMFAEDYYDTVGESYDEADDEAESECTATADSLSKTADASTANNNNNSQKVNTNNQPHIDNTGAQLTETGAPAAQHQQARVNGHAQMDDNGAVSNAGATSTVAKNPAATTTSVVNDNINITSTASAQQQHATVPPQAPVADTASGTTSTSDASGAAVSYDQQCVVTSTSAATLDTDSGVSEGQQAVVISAADTDATRSSPPPALPVSNGPKTYANLLKAHGARRSLPAAVHSTRPVGGEQQKEVPCPAEAPALASATTAVSQTAVSAGSSKDSAGVTSVSSGAAAAGVATATTPADCASATGAAAAVPSAGTTVDGERRRVPPDAHQIFVGNLPTDMSIQELIDHFKVYGPVLDARIIASKNNMSGEDGEQRVCPSYGFVVFNSSEVVGKILAQNPVHIDHHGTNHRLNVERKQSNRPGGGGRGRAGPAGGVFSRGGGMYRGGGRGSGGGGYSRGRGSRGSGFQGGVRR